MKCLFKKIVSTLMVVVLALSLMPENVFYCVENKSAKITYKFLGDEKDFAGYAQGKITLTGKKGTYLLFWANEKKALPGYSRIAKVKISDKKAVCSIAKNTVIPVGATKLIAISSSKIALGKEVSNASAVFDIPKGKVFGFQEKSKKYSFLSFSDVHIDTSSSSYPDSHSHWKMALDMAVRKKVDFMIGSGDNIQNNKNISKIYIDEWRNYQKILAESAYCNPIYEGLGNHEMWQGVKTGTDAFISATGLDGNNYTSKLGYYEVEIKGDHFIFMSLEGGFYPDRVDEFSDNQLDWLEKLLKKYSGDGGNIYIIEHSPIYKYGAGDRTDKEPYYSIPLNEKYSSTRRFKTLLETYKNTIFISGHTHIAFKAGYNFSDNNGKSAQMIHNSSVGGVREVVNGELDRNISIDETEAYVVDVYDDVIIFKGANLYRRKFNPNWCYYVKTSGRIYDEVLKGKSVIKDNQTHNNTVNISGDVDENGAINIKDATFIQKHINDIEILTAKNRRIADVNTDGVVNVKDITLVQKYIGGLISSFESDLSVDVTQTDVKLLLDGVKDLLELYYRYSSYDNYQTLKKEYFRVENLYSTNTLKNEQAEILSLVKLKNNLLEIVDAKNVDVKKKKFTIYFENRNNWSNVYANCMGAKNSRLVKCRKVKLNDAENWVYKLSVNIKKYNRIVFTNGKRQKTKEIYITDHKACYGLSGDKSPFEVFYII